MDSQFSLLKKKKGFLTFKILQKKQLLWEAAVEAKGALGKKKGEKFTYINLYEDLNGSPKKAQQFNFIGLLITNFFVH